MTYKTFRYIVAVGLFAVASFFVCRYTGAFELGDSDYTHARDQAELKRIKSDNRGSSTRRRLPIIVPPPSEILEHRKKLLKSRPPHQPEPDQGDKDTVVHPGARRLPVPLTRPNNKDRPGAPTKSEFLHILKTDPARARRLKEKYNLDASKIPPIRQLPSGSRQLPEDTRQRPTNTW